MSVEDKAAASQWHRKLRIWSFYSVSIRMFSKDRFVAPSAEAQELERDYTRSSRARADWMSHAPKAKTLIGTSEGRETDEMNNNEGFKSDLDIIAGFLILDRRNRRM